MLAADAREAADFAPARSVVTVEPFVDLPTWVRRAAGEEAELLAEFLGGSLRLAWKPRT